MIPQEKLRYEQARLKYEREHQLVLWEEKDQQKENEEKNDDWFFILNR